MWVGECVGVCGCVLVCVGGCMWVCVGVCVGVCLGWVCVSEGVCGCVVFDVCVGAVVCVCVCGWVVCVQYHRTFTEDSPYCIVNTNNSHNIVRTACTTDSTGQQTTYKCNVLPLQMASQVKQFIYYGP